MGKNSISLGFPIATLLFAHKVSLLKRRHDVIYPFFVLIFLIALTTQTITN